MRSRNKEKAGNRPCQDPSSTRRGVFRHHQLRQRTGNRPCQYPSTCRGVFRHHQLRQRRRRIDWGVHFFGGRGAGAFGFGGFGGGDGLFLSRRSLGSCERSEVSGFFIFSSPVEPCSARLFFIFRKFRLCRLIGDGILLLVVK